MTELYLSNLRSKLSQTHLDAFFVTDETDVQYLSGFSGDDTWLLITQIKAYLVTDFRYLEQAHQETQGFQIVRQRKGLVAKTIDLVKQCHIKRLGFDGEHLSLATAKEIAQQLPKRTRLRPFTGMIAQLRMIKTAEEISCIMKAIRYARDAFFQIRRYIKPGITEQEIATQLEYTMRRMGTERPAFPSIVASNERASLPHARTTKQPIPKPSLLQFDWGAGYNFYHSDISRVLFLGKVSKFWRKIYAIVLEAQGRAIEKVKPGAIMSDIDKAARSFIKECGYGKNFGHGLGHGIGRAVHELPRLRPKNEATLQPGMVFTIEPAIYLPGKGGIRIEDMVLVTPTGLEILTHSIPKDISQMVI